MTAVVFYKVQSAGLRRKLRRLFDAYGQRGASGFYELELTGAQWATILKALQNMRFEEGDQLYMYKLCRRCRPRARYYGSAKPAALPDFWIV
jgi:CRISPR-associated endonuclease Cas2